MPYGMAFRKPLPYNGVTNRNSVAQSYEQQYHTQASLASTQAPQKNASIQSIYVETISTGQHIISV